MSHEVQNELIRLMALSVLRKIAGDLQATEFISVMIDECTDIQNKEQVNIEPVTCMLTDMWLFGFPGSYCFTLGR